MESSQKLGENVNALLKTSEGELSHYFSEIQTHAVIGSTKASAHCYVLELDGNGMPPIDNLCKFLADNAADFAIPRSKVEEAKAYEAKHSSLRKTSALIDEAKSLFKTKGTSGEGGELLLYLMAQEFLKLPQLLCKMPLKTNNEMPVHGADGIHISVESEEGQDPLLCLYWCESKLYKVASQAIKECVQSLAAFVLADGGTERRARDLQLARDNMAANIPNEELEQALLKYLQKDAPLANRVNFRGIGLVGFDFEHYPSTQNTANVEALKQAITEELKKWIDKAHKEITTEKIDTIVIHLFILPLPSVEEFRKALLSALG